MSFELFDQIEDNSDLSINNLLKSVDKTNTAFFSEFSDLLNTLDKTADGYIKTTVSNLNKLSKYDKIYNSTLKSSPYWNSVTSYIGEFSTNVELINTYFDSLLLGFDPDKSMYNIVRQSGVDTTINSLLDSGLNQAFKDPVKKILQDAIINGSNKAEAIATLKDFVYGNSTRLPTLERYVSQVATDAINQYNGQYIATISDDLKLEHFYYKGTKIAESREFCIHLAGKFMTYDNLEAYLNSQTPWQGMIPGTNMGNFMVRRGGYNCRHPLIPVSKAVYEAGRSKL